MLKNSNLRIALVLAIGVAGILLFGPADQRISIAVSVMLVFAVILGAQWPPLSALILRRPRVALLVGVFLIAVGVLAIPAVFIWAPHGDSNLTVAMAATVSMVGVAVSVLPRSLATAAKLKAEGPPANDAGPRFQGLQEAVDAFGLLSRERGAFLRIVGPWLVLFCVIPWAFVDLAFWKALLGQHLTVGVLAILLALALMLCVPLIAAIQWGRFLATGRQPRLFAVPLGPLWGVIWRLFFAGVVLRLIESADPWLKAHLPSAAPWMISGLSGLFCLLVLVLASPWGMVFVAVALGVRDRSMAVSLRAARVGGRRFYLGMLVILSPIILLSWLTGLAPKTSGDGIVDWLMYFGWSLAMFATLIAVTTYLTRIYLRSLAKSGGSIA